MAKLQDKEIANVAGGTQETYTTEHNGFRPGDNVWYDEMQFNEREGSIRSAYQEKRHYAKLQYWRYNGANVEWFLELKSGNTEWQPENVLHHA